MPLPDKSCERHLRCVLAVNILHSWIHVMGYWDKMLAAWQGCGSLAEQPRACWMSYQTFQPITSMSTARASYYTLWSQMLQKAAFTQRRRKKRTYLPMRVFKFHLVRIFVMLEDWTSLKRVQYLQDVGCSN